MVIAASVSIAIQQAAEWLRPLPLPLFLFLPASRLRPIDETVSGDSKKRRNGNEVSSDDRGKWRQQRAGIILKSVSLQATHYLFPNPNRGTEYRLSRNEF
jgi:hypothetical protein